MKPTEVPAPAVAIDAGPATGAGASQAHPAGGALSPSRRASVAWWLRVAEAVLSVVLLGTCSHNASYWGAYGGNGLGITVAILGLAHAVLYLVAPRTKNTRLQGALPGILDACMAAVWAIFALATGGDAASASRLICFDWSGYYGGFYLAYTGFQGACAAQAITITAAFLLFLAWAATAGLAVMDIREGKGLWSPAGSHPAGAAAPAAPAVAAVPPVAGAADGAGADKPAVAATGEQNV